MAIIDKKRNGGQWTEARFHSFIKSGLRALSRKWPVKWEVLNDACTGRKENIKTGKQAKHYKCAECGKEFPAKDVQVDHIEPIIPLSGFVSWDETIERMLCEKDGLQVLCLTCHRAKSLEERKQSKALKNNNNKDNNND